MSLPNPTPFKVDDTERRRILAMVYSLLMGIADEIEELDTETAIYLVLPVEGPEPADPSAPLKSNSPP